MYSTVEAVRLALDPSADVDEGSDASNAAELTDEQLADAIAEADSKIDLYIGARYATPVLPVDPNVDPVTYPGPVPFWSRNVAAYLATLTLYQNAQMEPTTPVFLRYQSTMQELTAVRGGALINLPPVDSGTPVGGESGFGGVVPVGRPGLFDPSDWGNRWMPGTVAPWGELPRGW